MANLGPHLFRVLVFAASLSVLTAGPVAAMTCAPPDPWFLTTISLTGTPSLPQGVFVRVAPRRSEPTANQPPWDNSVLNWLELENTNSRPLFVLEDADEYQSRMGYEAISWPDEDVDVEHAVLSSFVVPVPTKLRLTVTRMRELGLRLADTAGQIYPGFNRAVTLATKYRKGSAYQSEASGFGLSADGIYKLCCGIALSRYVGVIEITIPDGPLFDVVLDATETNSNPAALACVRRQMLPAESEEGLRSVVASLGAEFIK